MLLAIKTPWSDGTTRLELSPTDLIARLAALMCRPRANQIVSACSRPTTDGAPK